MPRSQFKVCPFCAEEIRAAAIICRHCKTPLTPEAASQLRAAHGGALPTEEPGLESLSRFIPHTVLEGLREGLDSIDEGERRIVTILFADLSGFTQMSGDLDPEDLAGLVDEAYALMEEAVRRYDGIVDKFVGDAVLALFGAPLAHEDDPERSIRAGLDLRQSITELGQRRGTPLSVRVGIHLGEVVVKAFGTETRADYTAIGDAVNLASRLQGAATVGEVRVSERVARRVRGVFELEPHKPLTLRGIKRPVASFTVGKVLKSFSKGVIDEGKELTEFTGRETEMKRLAGLLDEVKEGRGRAVLIRGESGVGKSRLLHEFLHRHAAGQAAWFTGRCTSFGSSVPLQPFTELLRRMAGVDEASALSEVRSRIAELAKRHFPDRAPRRTDMLSRREIRAALGILLGIDDAKSPLHDLEPRERRARLHGALRATLLAQAAMTPTVFIFEDVHWADELSLELLDTLIESVASEPMLIVVLTRPSSAFRFSEENPPAVIELSELNDEQSALLLRRLLHLDELPAQAERFILHRTRGNPFFVEEVTLALREQGVLVPDGPALLLARPLEEARIPDTLESLILSRLDRLEGRVRRVVQCASVIGQEFRLRVLEQISETTDQVQGAISQLLAAEFILEKSHLPEIEYLFRNAITQEVAYHTLLRKRRALFHLRIAEALQALYPDRIEEHVELTAHHLYHGGAGAEARAFLTRAAQKCRLLDANVAALDFTERLLEVLRERLGGGASLAEPIGEALLELGRLHHLTGNNRTSLAQYREAEKHATSARLRNVRIIALRNSGDILRLLGHAKEGAKSIRRALRLCGPKDAELRATCHLNLGVNLMETGRLADARRELDRHFHWAKSRTTNLRQRYMASANLGLLCRALGDLDSAAEALDRASDLAEEMGRRRERAEALLNRADVDIDRGDLREAQRRLARALKLGEAIDHARLILTARLALGEVQRLRGRLDAAAEQTQRVLSEAAQTQEHMLVVLHLNLAQIRLDQGHFEEAATHVKEAERLAIAQGDQAQLPQIHAVAAQIAIAQGDETDAKRRAKEAVTLAKKLGSDHDLSLVLRAVGQVAQATGQREQAVAHWTEAERVARRLGAKRDLAWAMLFRAEAGNGGGPVRLKQMRDLANAIGDESLARRVRQLLRV